ncbi:MAG TPA: hypothetical protein VL742_03760 [Casimicrobiaceae bacterium]|nr:hypothetical protein [Casimicrobiaceae bacterium]
MTTGHQIVGIPMIRSDADIVEAFVRHSVRLLDHLFVMVHSPRGRDGRDLKASSAKACR